MEISIILIISIAILSIWWKYGREQIGKTLANKIMRQHARTPILLSLIWFIRAIMMIYVVTLGVFLYFSSEKDDLGDFGEVFILDISKSMETDDVKPNRLERAKREIEKSLESSKGKVGLVIFSGKAFVLAPLSGDITGIKRLLSTLSTHTIDQSKDSTSGTNLSEALLAGMKMQEKDIGLKLALYTDGRANVGIDPIVLIEKLKKNNISLEIYGIGNATGVLLSHIDGSGQRVPLIDGGGSTQDGSVDRKYLSDLALKGSGSIIFLDSNSSESAEADTRKRKAIIDKGFLYSFYRIYLPFLIVLYIIISIIFLIGSKRR